MGWVVVVVACLCVWWASVGVSVSQPDTSCGVEKPSIFLFSTMKIDLSNEEKQTGQLNAIKSWYRLRCYVQVIVFAKDDETQNFIKAASSNSIIILDKFAERDHLPIVKSMFRRAELKAAEITEGSLDVALIYVNSDMIFDESLIHTISALRKQSKSFFGIGCRCNFDSTKSRLNLDALPEMPCDLWNPWAMDYFIYTPGLFRYDEFPAFMVGRVRYDNWINMYMRTESAKNSSIITVDTTNSLKALHVLHGDVRESHHKNNTNNMELWMARKKEFKKIHINTSKTTYCPYASSIPGVASTDAASHAAHGAEIAILKRNRFPLNHIEQDTCGWIP